MSFHPDSNLPGCMMPDGGECCAGHSAVVEDWHKQRREIERLRGLETRITALESEVRVLKQYERKDPRRR
jgi:hypothetical protein